MQSASVIPREINGFRHNCSAQDRNNNPKNRDLITILTINGGRHKIKYETLKSMHVIRNNIATINIHQMLGYHTLRP